MHLQNKDKRKINIYKFPPRLANKMITNGPAAKTNNKEAS
jgi:hypothetical protein